MNRAREWSQRDIWIRKLLYPTYRWPGVALAASPIIVATAVAIHDGVFSLTSAALAFLSGWLLQLAGALYGNYKNLLEDPNDSEHPELAQAVKSGNLQLNAIKGAAYVCFLLVALACTYLFFIAGVGIILFGVAGIIGSLAYSSGPFPLGKIGAADPLFFLFFGVVAVLGTYYVQAAPVLSPSPLWQVVYQALPWKVVAISLPVGALATNILIIDDIRDQKFDSLKGKRTITVRFGLFWSRLEFLTLIGLSYLSLFWLWISVGYDIRVLFPLLTIPIALIVAYKLLTSVEYRDLLPLKRIMAKLLLSFSILLAIGIVLS